MNKKSKKKGRWQSFHSDGEEGLKVENIESINLLSGEMKLKKGSDLPDKITVKTSYMRSTGKNKITTQSELKTDKNILHIDPDPSSHLKNYDLIFAIDTNNKQQLNGDSVTAGSVVYGQPSTINTEIGIGFSPMITYYFKNLRIKPFKPEPFVWYCFLQGLESLKSAKKIRIALIVDSDLDLLPEMNSQNVPIWEEYYLPPFVDLIYASADKKNDSIQNRMIAYADKCAGDVIKSNIITHDSSDSLISDYSTILAHKDYKNREFEKASDQYYIPITANFLPIECR